MVKKFSNDMSGPREKKRFGGSWLGSGRSGKRNSRGRVIDDGEPGLEVEAITYRGSARRSQGASEITFWKEDAQVYYEMELWGVLYAPDVREAVIAGNYVENISFEIELAK
jgi:hypothetical protein